MNSIVTLFLACSVSLDELWDKQTDLEEFHNGADALQHANGSEHPYASIIQVESSAELLEYENWKGSIRNGTGDDSKLHQNGVIPRWLTANDRSLSIGLF